MPVVKTSKNTAHAKELRATAEKNQKPHARATGTFGTGDASGPAVTVGAATSTPPAAAPAAKSPAHHWGFAEVLSALNPLQYVPVVGTIYRAVTGDRIPEGLQIVGSLAVGTALSGPIGLVTGIATIIAEKVTGIDPDKIAHRVAVGLGIAPETPSPPAPTATASAAQPPAGSAPLMPGGKKVDPLRRDQSPSPLPGGGWGEGSKPNVAGLSTTEALNQHELDRIRAANAAYAMAAALT